MLVGRLCDPFEIGVILSDSCVLAGVGCEDRRHLQLYPQYAISHIVRFGHLEDM